MNFKIKEEVLKIYQQLKEGRHEAYLVGGCVRNLLMEKAVTDWDLTTNATPTEIQKLFPDSFYDNIFGTVGVPFEEKRDEKDPYQKNYCEITTFRKEAAYTDRRHPEKIEWGTTIEDDLSRRDFTINAIALNIDANTPNINPKLIDPYNGQNDIVLKVIRAVGNPNARFKEDALRLLRAVRFAAQLGFTIEDATWNAIKKDASLLKHVSGERVRDELLKILASENPYEGIKILDNAGLLEIIIPELTYGKNVSQQRPGRHHTTDVFIHNLLSLKNCPSKDPIVRLATLIHDIGKPYVAGEDEKGLIIFYNHEVAGAKIAREIVERLRLSKKEKGKIIALIRWHMFTIDEHITDSAIRRFIRRIGIENVKDMIDLRIGDRLGGGTQVAESWRLKKFKERLEQQLHPPFSINDLAIDGNDIMKELGIKPGPQVGKILQTLFEEVDEDLEKNNKEYLLEHIKKIGS